MSFDGWVKIHRKIQEDPIWLSETFSKGQAFVDLILIANHSPSYFYKRGVKIDVNRGQCGVSEVGLSDRWKWSRTKVRKFLKDLEKEQQIIVEKSNVTQVVTIINYEKYQEKEQQKNSRRTAEEQQKDTNKNDKNDKNDKKTTISKFDVFSFCPDWISEKDWKDLVIHRRKVKATETERAYSSVVEEIKKAGDLGFSVKTCIDEICNRSWKGFRADWLKQKQQVKNEINGKQKHGFSDSCNGKDWAS